MHSYAANIYSWLSLQSLKVMAVTQLWDAGSLHRAPPTAIRHQAMKAARLQTETKDSLTLQSR